MAARDEELSSLQLLLTIFMILNNSLVTRHRPHYLLPSEVIQAQFELRFRLYFFVVKGAYAIQVARIFLYIEFIHKLAEARIFFAKYAVK